MFFAMLTTGTVTGPPVNGDADWYEVGTDRPPDDISDDIYTIGKVGIGTASPIAGLDVRTDVDSATLGIVKGVNFEQILRAADTNNALIAVHINPTFADGIYSGVGHYGLIVESGLVGIGTTRPTAELEVNGTVKANSFVGDLAPTDNTDMGNYLITNIGNANTGFTSGGGLNVAGNVGINTTNPQYELEVHGEKIWFNCSYIKLGSNTYCQAPKKNSVVSNESYRIIIDEVNQANDYYFAVGVHEKHNEPAWATNELFWIRENGSVGVGVQKPLGRMWVHSTPYIGSGNISSSGTTVTGTGTSFTTEMMIGSEIWIEIYHGPKKDDWQKEIRRVVAINSDTSITIDSAFNPDLPSGTNYNYTRPILCVATSENVGISTISPTEKLDVNGRARVRDLPLDNTLTYFVVANSTGVLHKRDGSTVGTLQNLWETINGDSGSTIADNPNDILNVTGAGIVSTSISGDTLTITATEADGDPTNEIDADWYEVGTTNPPDNINDNIYTYGNVGIGTNVLGATLDVHTTSGGSATIGHSSNSATGLYAIAMGSENTAIGWESVAMGLNTTASGGQSTAMGCSTQASGVYSTAMGHSTIASGHCSIATGENTVASGPFSTAIGYGVTASGQFSTAMGRSITVQGMNSFGIGLSYYSPGWTISQANAMAVMGGNVGIGTVSPQHLLHIAGDMYLEGRLYDGTHDAGTNLQILSSTGSYVDWIDNPDSSSTNEIQNLWETINGDSGSTIADNPNDILNVTGAGIVSTSISGDTLTITATEADGDPTNEIDADWYEVGTTNPPDDINDNIYTYGNVAIGTATPYATLHVYGDVVFGQGNELTISSGAVTQTHSYHTVDTEGDAGSDDLTTINGGYAGNILIIRTAHAARTVVVRHCTGNIYLTGGNDFTMDNVMDTLVLIYTGAYWLELCRSEI